MYQHQMSQNAEAEAFLARIASLPSGPGVSLDAVLQASLDDEAVLRKLFAINKAHPRLANIHVGLVDVFAAPAAARTTRARVVPDDAALAANYVLPLSDARRRKEGAPATVPDLDAFKNSWGIFTEGSLSQLTDWNNVVAAGGSVLACLSPLPDAAKVTKRTTRKYFHEAAYPSSDIDLFLWGLTPEQVSDVWWALIVLMSRDNFAGGAQDRRHLRSGAGLCSLGCHLRPHQAHRLHPL